jgi:hypothetical protein
MGNQWGTSRQRELTRRVLLGETAFRRCCVIELGRIDVARRTSSKGIVGCATVSKSMTPFLLSNNIKSVAMSLSCQLFGEEITI